MAPSKTATKQTRQTKQEAPKPETKQEPAKELSRFDKLLAKQTKALGRELTDAEKDVVRAHADYLDKAEAAGMGRSKPRTAVSDEIMRRVDVLTVMHGKNLVDDILELVPGYRVSALTMQIRMNEPKLRTVRINRPRSAKEKESE